MKKTTLVLAFCATLMLTSTAAALVIAQPPARKQPKRKGETDVATRVFTPTIKEGRKVIDRPAAAIDTPAPAPTAEVTAPKPDSSVVANVPTQPVVEAEAEPEVITEYYPSGAVRAVYRGFRHKNFSIELSTSSLPPVNGNIVIDAQENEADSYVAKEQREMFKQEQKLQVEVQTKLNDCCIKRLDYNIQDLGTIMLEIPATRHGLYESYYENGTLESRGEYDHGAYKGFWSFHYENGQLRESGEFVNNARQGHWTTYYANGLRASESDWVNGVENGAHTDWHETGLMAATGTVKNGLREGYWIYWSEDGAKLREGNCENGNETGEWQNYQPTLRKQQVQQEIDYQCQELIDEDPLANPEIKTVIHTR